MSLRLYCGEYLVSPVPLHFGMNHCSHACLYCFANLNRRGRRMENNDLPRIARWFERDSGPLEYWFLKQGYPMQVSNDTDPFCRSNSESFRALFELSESCGFALCYQTKGGDRETEDLALSGRKTMFYVSVTSDNNDILRQMEPAAPSYEHRLDLIARAVRAGHHVVVGLNPLVPGWWHDLPAALSRIRDLGVAHIWTGELHFSRFQVDSMPLSLRTRHADLVEYGLLKNKPDDMVRGELLQYAHRLGFSVFSNGRGSRLGFWDPYFRLGYPFFPTLDGLFQQLEHDGAGRSVIFDFAWFRLWSTVHAPEGLSIFRDYLQPYARSLRNAGEDMRCRSFDDVHKIEWRMMDYPTRLRSEELSYVYVGTGDDRSLLEDAEGRELLCYVPGGTAEPAVPADSAVYIYHLPAKGGE